MRSLCVGMCIAAAGALLTAQQPTKFRSKVESVRVDVLALAGGRPLAGLTVADFEVRDNGVLQTINLLASDSAPINLAIALDTSSSLTAERLEALRSGSRALVRKLRAGDLAGLLTFSHVVVHRQALTATHAAIEPALSRAPEAGHTALVDATYAGLSLAETAQGRGLLMIFSDGIDTASWLDPGAVVQAARRSETVVYAVSSAVGGHNAGFLHDVTAATGGKVLEVKGGNLDAAFAGVVDEFRQRYLLSYEPQGVAKGGWHRLEVRVKRRGATTRARPGYFDR